MLDEQPPQDRADPRTEAHKTEADKAASVRSDASPANRERDGSDGDASDGNTSGPADVGSDETADQAREKRPSLLRRHPFWILFGILLVAALAVAGYVYWLVYAEPYESTDDAFIDSRQFAISPKVAGYIAAAPVVDNGHVDGDDILFQIDDRDYKAALDQAEARVAAAAAAVQGADAQIAAQIAQVDEARTQVTESEASVQFARQQAGRAQELVRSGAGTVQSAQQQTSTLQQEEAALARARAGVTSAQKQVGSLQAQKATAIADQREAEAQLRQAQLNLTYVTVTAAQPGRVVRLTGAEGQYVQAGQGLAMFVPDEIWVTANFKETQITDMRPGQPVDIRIDAYPDHEIQGVVDSVQPGSGTAFSLLPAENATGNYVKVVQRVPVKIVAKDWPRDVSIGPGMSVVPTVTVRPRD